MTAMPVLETLRLIVRPFTLDDGDDVNAVLNSAWGESLTAEEREPWLRWTVASYESLAALHQPPYGDRAVVERRSGRVVGVVGLVPSYGPFGTLPSFGGRAEETLFRPELGLYWAIARECQGKGFATEAAGAIVRHAFEGMSARAVVATTEFDNAASIGVMRKLGMSIERNPNADPPWFQVRGVLFNPRGAR